MFKGRHFEQSVILLCVRWYLSYGLSLRDLKEMMAERGISVDHSTIHRWVVHFAPLLADRFNRRKRAVTGRWHADETYIKVRGRWTYLYRAIDSNGDTVEFRLSEHRDLSAAKRFFRKAFGRSALSSMAARPTGKRSFPVTPQAAFRIGPAVVLNPYAFDRVSI
jgi:transposase-like protein